MRGFRRRTLCLQVVTHEDTQQLNWLGQDGDSQKISLQHYELLD